MRAWGRRQGARSAKCASAVEGGHRASGFLGTGTGRGHGGGHGAAVALRGPAKAACRALGAGAWGRAPDRLMGVKALGPQAAVAHLRTPPLPTPAPWTPPFLPQASAGWQCWTGTCTTGTGYRWGMVTTGSGTRYRWGRGRAVVGHDRGANAGGATGDRGGSDGAKRLWRVVSRLLAALHVCRVALVRSLKERG